MERRFNDRLVIATHNPGKLDEFRRALAPYVAEIVSLGDLALPVPDETGTTFEDNALIKARAAAEASGCVALADDSGLCVAALGGAPGVRTADWCGPAHDPMVGMQRVRDAMGDADDRSAHFACWLALAWPDGCTDTMEGRVDGSIVWPPVGDHGHGYDPIFRPRGEDRTFAAMTMDEKQRFSHRGAALRVLIARYFGSVDT